MSGNFSAPDEAALHANVRRFYLYRFLSNLNLWLPIWVLYLQQERGLSLGQITALDAPFWLISVAAQVPTGAFADRFGRKYALVAGCVVSAAGYLVFGLASSYPILLFSYVLWAAGLAFQSGADLALLYDDLIALGRVEEYQKVAGRAYGLTSAAAVVALLVGAELAKLTRLDVPILVSAGITLVAAGVAAGFHEPPRGRGARPNALRTMRNAIGMVWQRPPLRYLLGFSAAITAASFVPVIFVQPFLAHYHTPVGAYGLLQTPGRLMDIVAALVAYRVARALSARKLLVWLTLWLCATTVMVAAWQSPVAFVAFPLMALGFGGANPVLSDCLNRIIPSAERATVLSLGHVVDGLILIGFEPALGAAAQARGISAAFVGATAFLVLGGALTLLPYLRASRPVHAPVESSP